MAVRESSSRRLEAWVACLSGSRGGGWAAPSEAMARLQKSLALDFNIELTAGF